jgi:Leucine-rich repeat (LRR) protein
MDALYTKLDPRDSIVFSTLSKECLRIYRPPEALHDIMLVTVEDIVSFSRWIQRYGRAVKKLTFVTNFTPMSEALPSFLAGACPCLSTLALDVPTIDTAALMLLNSRLQHLTLTLSGYGTLFSLNCIQLPFLKSLTLLHGQSRNFIFPDSFPLLQWLTIENYVLEDELTHMPSLRALELPRCSLTIDTVDSIASLTLLTRVQLSGNNIVFAPDALRELVHLEELDLSHNILNRYGTDGMVYDDIFESITGLRKLKELNISHNRIDTVGMQELENLQCINLQRLDISCNPCTGIPIGGYLRSLKRLTTSCVPRALKKMKCLEELHFHGYCTTLSIPPAEDEDDEAPVAVVPRSLHTVWLDEGENPIPVKLVHSMLELVKHNPRLSLRR